MKRPSATPKVLQRLYGEHRYLSALVRVLEEKTGPRVRHKTADYYLLRDIVGYVHDYPDHVHHPTEDLLLERILLKDPTQAPIVERLRQDHRELQAETRQLLNRLDSLVDGRPSEAQVRAALEACRSLARHQRAHIDLENREAFPAAIDVLSAADWQAIERRYLTAEDPLFGNPARGRHRPLYEYLLDYAEGGDHEGLTARLWSADRLARAGDVLIKGVGDGWSRLANLREALASESRTAFQGSGRLPASPLLPAKLALGLGRSTAACSADLLRICTATAKGALAAYLARDPAR